MKKNKEKPKDYYANDEVWTAVYSVAPQELKDAMDLAYLTGQRPADVLAIRSDDMSDGFLTVKQGKTAERLRIHLNDGEVRSSLGELVYGIIQRNAKHICRYSILSERGRRLSWMMLRNRWVDTREKAASIASQAGQKNYMQFISASQICPKRSG